MDAERDELLSVLANIRGSGLLLSLATAYLCEGPFLKRIGREIEVNVRKLREEIGLLRGRFPGKLAREVDTEGHLNQLGDLAGRLQNPDKETVERCGLGHVGRDLEACTTALTLAIHAVRAQVEGKPAPPARREAVSAVLQRGVPAVSDTVLRVGKIFLYLVVIAALAFGYLFFTMEKVGDLEEKVGGMESQLHSEKRILAGLEEEKTRISEKLNSLERRSLDRKELIEIVELGAQVRSIEEKQRDREVDISIRESTIRSQREKIRELRSKSFVRRLLRQ